jgi:hypothetical protein
MALHSKTQLKPHEKFFIPNYHFYRTGRFPGRKGRTAVGRGIPHNRVDLPSLVSVEATRVSRTIGNSEVLLAAPCKSLGHAWNDADITELFSFIRQTLMEGDLNHKHPFWNSVVSSP